MFTYLLTYTVTDFHSISVDNVKGLTDDSSASRI